MELLWDLFHILLAQAEGKVEIDQWLANTLLGVMLVGGVSVVGYSGKLLLSTTRAVERIVERLDAMDRRHEDEEERHADHEARIRALELSK